MTRISVRKSRRSSQVLENRRKGVFNQYIQISNIEICLLVKSTPLNLEYILLMITPSCKLAIDIVSKSILNFVSNVRVFFFKKGSVFSSLKVSFFFFFFFFPRNSGLFLTKVSEKGGGGALFIHGEHRWVTTYSREWWGRVGGFLAVPRSWIYPCMAACLKGFNLIRTVSYQYLHGINPHRRGL